MCPNLPDVRIYPTLPYSRYSPFQESLVNRCFNRKNKQWICLLYNYVKRLNQTQPAYNLGPMPACRRNAIRLAFRWWANSGLLLCAYWEVLCILLFQDVCRLLGLHMVHVYCPSCALLSYMSIIGILSYRDNYFVDRFRKLFCKPVCIISLQVADKLFWF